jgi:hypothetical protein
MSRLKAVTYKAEELAVRWRTKGKGGIAPCVAGGSDELLANWDTGRIACATEERHETRREIPPLRHAPPLRGGKAKTRGFGRDDMKVRRSKRHRF